MRTKVKVLLMTAVFTLLFVYTVFAAPEKVTGLRQTGAGKDSCEVEWDAVFGSDIYYEVSFSRDGKQWEVMEEDSRVFWCSYWKMKLNPGENYYVRVRAKQSDVYGEYSDTFTAVTAPEKAQNLKQTAATTSSVTITWDKVKGATSYQVYSNNSLTGTTTGTTYTFKGLNNKTRLSLGTVYVVPVRKNGKFEASMTFNYDSDYNYIDDLKIVPGKVENVEIVNIGLRGNVADIDCDELVNASEYQYEVYNYKNKKVQTDTSGMSWFYSAKILGAQFYKIRVRGYVTVNGKKIYGAWSKDLYFTNTVKVKVRSAGRKYKVSWKKVKGATSYTVYMASKNSKSKKVVTTKKLKTTISKFKKKKLKKGNWYSIYVVANKKVGKKTIKSNDRSAGSYLL